MTKPIVAVVGRPNVGKSTFVNRIVGTRSSIVDDQPGVTRDRIYFDVEWQDKKFTLIDTGGIIPGDEDEIMLNIFTQAKVACEEADKIIFLVDGKDGINPVDYDIANVLRRSGKPVYLAVNKIDAPEHFNNIADFYALSLGEPQAISALHGSGGVGDLLEAITKDFDSDDSDIEERELIAAKFGFQYKELESGLGIIVNGDGLALNTINQAKDMGINTACFLNLKGGVDRDKISASIKLIMTNPRVDGIFINILGGFSRCNLIADGIITVADDLGLNIPLVARFEGTNKDEATDILKKSGLPLAIAEDTTHGLQLLKEAIAEDL